MKATDVETLIERLEAETDDLRQQIKEHQTLVALKHEKRKRKSIDRRKDRRRKQE